MQNETARLFNRCSLAKQIGFHGSEALASAKTSANA